MKVKTNSYGRYASVLALSVLGLVISGLAFTPLLHADNQEIVDQERASLLTVNTATLLPENVYSIKRKYIGRVEANQNTAVGFELAGKLASVLVDEGDSVEKGQVLATLDTERLRVQKRELVARVMEIETRIKLSNVTLERMEKALQYEGVTSQQVDEARQQRDASQASLSVINASIDAIDTEIKKSTLVSPFDAYVIARQSDNGRVVEAGQPVLTLQQRSVKTARIGIAGDAIQQFRVGEIVSVSVEGNKNEGKVRTIVPVRNAITRIVDVILELNDAVARPGDLVEVDIEQSVTADGYWVPLTALSEGERGTWTLLLAEQRNGSDTYRLTRHFVDIVHKESNRVFIQRFEHELDQYVTNGLQRVVPGQFVHIEQNGAQLVAGVEL